MSDEPSHKAMLYFLEVLMNSSGQLTISQLAGRFGSSNFTSEMRVAAGGNEIGLKTFLQKYPSLFTIKGNMVSLCDGREDEDATSQDGSITSNSTLSSRRSLPDVSVEMEAVQFFQNQMLKREEKWVPVKSLAGHLSQTTQEIRNVVGPQLEFRGWLLRHVHIFEVQGEMVSLRDGLAPSPTTPGSQRKITFDLPDSRPVPPKTPPAQRRYKQNATPGIPRSHSFGDRSQLFQGDRSAFSFNNPPKNPVSQITMTANEYKTVMFLKDTLEKRGSMRIQALLGCVIGDALIRNTAGCTKVDMEEFLKRFPGIFIISQSTPEDANVELVKNAKLSVVITSNKPMAIAVPQMSSSSHQQPSRNATNSGKGKIFHVAKLWGIIDLGDHEHVFFDRSIMQRPMEDLQKYFQIGEILCFNAVLAHKTSRAKWKATRVWKENEQEPIMSACQENSEQSNMDRSGSIGSIEEEVNKFLPQQDKRQVTQDTSVYVDAGLSGAGAVPIWNFRQDEEKNKRASVTVVPESYQMSASALSDLRFTSDFGSNFLVCKGASPLDASSPHAALNGSLPGKSKQKTFATVACQTVSTSDIIATQLYQDS